MKILHLASLGTVLNENTEIKHTLHFQLDAIPLDLLCKKACVAISSDWVCFIKTAWRLWRKSAYWCSSWQSIWKSNVKIITLNFWVAIWHEGKYIWCVLGVIQYEANICRPDICRTKHRSQCYWYVNDPSAIWSILLLILFLSSKFSMLPPEVEMNKYTSNIHYQKFLCDDCHVYFICSL